MSGFNLILTNNIMDKGFIPYSLVITGLIYGGIFRAFFDDKSWTPDHTKVLVNFSFSALIVILFMII